MLTRAVAAAGVLALTATLGPGVASGSSAAEAPASGAAQARVSDGDNLRGQRIRDRTPRDHRAAEHNARNLYVYPRYRKGWLYVQVQGRTCGRARSSTPHTSISRRAATAGRTTGSSTTSRATAMGLRAPTSSGFGAGKHRGAESAALGCPRSGGSTIASSSFTSHAGASVDRDACESTPRPGATPSIARAAHRGMATPTTYPAPESSAAGSRQESRESETGCNLAPTQPLSTGRAESRRPYPQGRNGREGELVYGDAHLRPLAARSRAGTDATALEGSRVDQPPFEDFVVARSPQLLRTAHLLTRDRTLAQDLLQAALADSPSTGKEGAVNTDDLRQVLREDADEAPSIPLPR